MTLFPADSDVTLSVTSQAVQSGGVTDSRFPGQQANTQTFVGDGTISVTGGGVTNDQTQQLVVTNTSDVEVTGSELNHRTTLNFGLTNPFTQADKDKLDAIPEDAERNVQSDWNEADTTSDRYIRNKPETITEAERTAITENTAKRSYPLADSEKLATIERGAEVNVQSDWNVTNIDSDAYIQNKPTTISAAQAAAITANTAKRSYPLADSEKLATIERNADVTDTENVVAALTAGANITISPTGVIAADLTAEDYFPGRGIALDTDTRTFSVDSSYGLNYTENTNDGQLRVDTDVIATVSDITTVNTNIDNLNTTLNDRIDSEAVVRFNRDSELDSRIDSESQVLRDYAEQLVPPIFDSELSGLVPHPNSVENSPRYYLRGDGQWGRENLSGSSTNASVTITETTSAGGSRAQVTLTFTKPVGGGNSAQGLVFTFTAPDGDVNSTQALSSAFVAPTASALVLQLEVNRIFANIPSVANFRFDIAAATITFEFLQIGPVMNNSVAISGNTNFTITPTITSQGTLNADTEIDSTTFQLDTDYMATVEYVDTRTTNTQVFDTDNNGLVPSPTDTEFNTRYSLRGDREWGEQTVTGSASGSTITTRSRVVTSGSRAQGTFTVTGGGAIPAGSTVAIRLPDGTNATTTYLSATSALNGSVLLLLSLRARIAALTGIRNVTTSSNTLNWEYVDKGAIDTDTPVINGLGSNWTIVSSITLQGIDPIDTEYAPNTIQLDTEVGGMATRTYVDQHDGVIDTDLSGGRGIQIDAAVGRKHTINVDTDYTLLINSQNQLGVDTEVIASVAYVMRNSGGANQLNELSDVTTANDTERDLLSYDNGQWRNSQVLGTVTVNDTEYLDSLFGNPLVDRIPLLRFQLDASYGYTPGREVAFDNVLTQMDVTNRNNPRFTQEYVDRISGVSVAGIARTFTNDSDTELQSSFQRSYTDTVFFQDTRTSAFTNSGHSQNVVTTFQTNTGNTYNDTTSYSWSIPPNAIESLGFGDDLNFDAFYTSYSVGLRFENNQFNGVHNNSSINDVTYTPSIGFGDETTESFLNFRADTSIVSTNNIYWNTDVSVSYSCSLTRPASVYVNPPSETNRTIPRNGTLNGRPNGQYRFWTLLKTNSGSESLAESDFGTLDNNDGYSLASFATASINPNQSTAWQTHNFGQGAGVYTADNSASNTSSTYFIIVPDAGRLTGTQTFRLPLANDNPIPFTEGTIDLGQSAARITYRWYAFVITRNTQPQIRVASS